MATFFLILVTRNSFLLLLLLNGVDVFGNVFLCPLGDENIHIVKIVLYDGDDK